MKCPNCSITVPEMPEDAKYSEALCNRCHFLDELGVGDEVYWNDPDENICSGVYKVKEIISKDVLLIENDAGSQVEVFTYEVS